MAVVIDGVKSFEGCVVNEYEENYINDSYWYAVVWNGSEFEEILYRTTAAAGAGCATVDASEELMKKYLKISQDDLNKIAIEQEQQENHEIDEQVDQALKGQDKDTKEQVKEDVKKELLKLLKLTLQHDSAKILEDYGKNYKIRKIANLQGVSSTSFSLDGNVIESLLKRRER